MKLKNKKIQVMLHLYIFKIKILINLLEIINSIKYTQSLINEI